MCGRCRDSQSLSRSGSMRRYASGFGHSHSHRLSSFSRGRGAGEGLEMRTESPAELAYARDGLWNEDSFLQDAG